MRIGGVYALERVSRDSAKCQQVIDVLYPRIEKLASYEILLQAPVVEGRAFFLVSALRIVPELGPGQVQDQDLGRDRPRGRSPVPGQQQADSAGRDHRRPTAKTIAVGLQMSTVSSG